MLSKETDITKYQEGVSDHDLVQSYVEPVDVKYKNKQIHLSPRLSIMSIPSSSWFNIASQILNHLGS